MQMKRFELKIYCHDLIVIKDSTEHSSIESIYLTNAWRSFSFSPSYLLLIHCLANATCTWCISCVRLAGHPSLESPYSFEGISRVVLNFLSSRSSESILAGSTKYCVPHLPLVEMEADGCRVRIVQSITELILHSGYDSLCAWSLLSSVAYISLVYSIAKLALMDVRELRCVRWHAVTPTSNTTFYFISRRQTNTFYRSYAFTLVRTS